MLEISQETLKSLLENSPGIIIILDRDYRIQFINHTVPGLKMEDVIGTSQFDYIEPKYHDFVRKTIDSVFETGMSSSYELEGLGADGETVWYSTLVGPIKQNGDVVGVSLFATDVTARKKAEEAFREASVELMAQQTSAIQELSTPVIQIWDEILVLPLIGMIEPLRAQQIMERLLDAIVKTQSSVVIVEITGVPMVDTMVADYLVKTIRAVSLLGASVILAGVSPGNAHIMVRLGVDLSDLTIKGSLQDALKTAFQMTGQLGFG